MKPARLVALGLAVAALAGSAPAAGASRRVVPARPNVVVIMTDDQTIEQMRFMPLTRRLIGARGATFRTSLSSYPLCCPSRATFLTGQYAHNHGVLENQFPTGGYARLDAGNTLPVWLRAAGYRTVHVGKFLNGYGEEDPAEIPAGWDEWYGLVDPSTYRMWGYTMNENGRLKTYGDIDIENPRLYQTDVLARRAVGVIRRLAPRAQPFYLQLWPLASHREFDARGVQVAPRPAPRHRSRFSRLPMPRTPAFNEADMSDKPLFMQIKPTLSDAAIRVIERRYRMEAGTLLAVDEAVRDIVRALDRAGELARTVIVFTSDNGYFHGEHRTPDEKILAYEVSSRVPLLIRGPGVRPGSVIDEPVVNADLAPTIAEIAGATPTLSVDGRSVAPFLRDPVRRSTRPLLLEAYFPIGSAVGFFENAVGGGGGGGGSEGDEGALPLGKTILSYEGVRTDRYAYVEYTSGERELYDLERDPFQIQSVHRDPAYAAPLLQLTLALERLRLCSGDGCRFETGPIPGPGA
jgi:N-acetylglucosamine-6-sulfatase